MKHTPGPWSINDTRTWCDGAGCVDIRDTNNRWLASVHGNKDNHLGFSHDEATDNARLIAAAPELLAAAIELMRCAHEPSGPDFGNIVTGDMRYDAVDAMRAAIAKAEGK